MTSALQWCWAKFASAMSENDTPGVWSSTRLLALAFYLLTAETVALGEAYVLLSFFYLHQQPSGPALGGFAAIITALGSCGAYTQGKRT